MNSPSPIFSHLSLIPFLLLLFRISSADDGDWLYDSCATIFNCGFITGLGYPFRAYTAPANCSYPGLALNCQKDIPTIQIMNLTYRLLDLNLAKQTMVIAREDAVGSVCPQDLVNTTLDNSLFEYSPGYVNLTFLYGCPAWLIPSLTPVSGCTVSGYKEVYWLPGSVVPFSCKVSVTVPVSPRSGSINSTNLGQVLGGGVEVTWKVDGSACSYCRESKGRCGFDFLSNQTTCFCPNPPYVSATCAVDAGAPSSESSPRTGSVMGCHGKHRTSDCIVAWEKCKRLLIERLLETNCFFEFCSLVLMSCCPLQNDHAVGERHVVSIVNFKSSVKLSPKY